MADATRGASEALDLFSRALYCDVARATPAADNVLLSPLSAATALAMTLAGAGGDTASQMMAVLGHADRTTDVHAGYQALLTALRRPDGVQLNAANRLYVQQSFRILDSYAGLLRDKYAGEVRSVDFGDAAGTSRLINGEVEKLTGGKIKDLVPADSLSAAIRLVLVNGVHFKAGWEHAFKVEWTEEGDFFAPAGPVRARLMTLDGTYLQGSNSVPGLDCQAVELPFAGRRFGMLLLLPRARDGLPQLERQLADVSLADVRGSLRSLRSRVVVPRFRLDAGLELREPLQRLGMVDLFSAARADLSGVTGARGLAVDSVLHKAFVAVDEEGCEAAAATAVKIRLMAMRAPELLDFRADHPFVVVICDRETGVALFTGRLASP